MNTDELKPCPFCGGEASLYENENERTGDTDGLFFVRCNPCDLIYDKAWCVPCAEAVAAWNTRASQPDAALREALEAICKVQVNGWDNIWAGADRCRAIARKALDTGAGRGEA